MISVLHCSRPKVRDFDWSEIVNMLAMNVIEPAKTERASPVAFATKKDGTLTFFVTYRKLSAVNIRNFNPLPRLDECVASFGDAQVF